MMILWTNGPLIKGYGPPGRTSSINVLVGVPGARDRPPWATQEVSSGVDGDTVLRAASECQAFLGGTLDRDWTRPIPDMDWTVAQAVAHIGESLLWYATDLAAGPRELSAMDLRVRPETAPADLVAMLGSYATVLARVIDGAAPGARGWHPAGLADASGFAAMACDELLVHTDDAARGLGLGFTRPRR
jgi:uncharacterized protein (TIGR03083 family)